MTFVRSVLRPGPAGTTVPLDPPSPTSELGLEGRPTRCIAAPDHSRPTTGESPTLLSLPVLSPTRIPGRFYTRIYLRLSSVPTDAEKSPFPPFPSSWSTYPASKSLSATSPRPRNGRETTEKPRWRTWKFVVTVEAGSSSHARSRPARNSPGNASYPVKSIQEKDGSSFVVRFNDAIKIWRWLGGRKRATSRGECASHFFQYNDRVARDRREIGPSFPRKTEE